MSKDVSVNECPCCGSVGVVESSPKVFSGQVYSDRYDEPVASQNHDFQIRCAECGLQTCWWHHRSEAIEAWNKRVDDDTDKALAEATKKQGW